MHRIDGDNVAVALPTPQAVGATVGYFAAEDDPPFTQVTGDWLNAVQEEIATAIEDSTQTLDKTANDQLSNAVRSLGGRTWYRSVPLGSGGSVHYIAGDAGDILVEQKGNVTQITRTSTDACSVQVAWPIPMDIRSIKVTEIEFRVKLDTAFTGTVTALAAFLYRVDANGGTTPLGSLAMNELSTGVWSFKLLSDFSASEFTLLVQQGLYVQVNASIDGGGAGDISFQMLTLVLSEGWDYKS